MCPVVHHRSTNQILETTIQKNKTPLGINLISGHSAECDSTELTVNCWELCEILISLQLGVWTLRDAQSHRFNLSSQYVDVTGVQEKHIPVTKPLNKLSLNTCKIYRGGRCVSARSHTLSGGVVAAAELYSWDSAVLLTAGVPVAVVPWYESGRGPWRNGKATDAELPQKHKMRIRTRHKLLMANNCPLELIFRWIIYL